MYIIWILIQYLYYILNVEKLYLKELETVKIKTQKSNSTYLQNLKYKIILRAS